MDTSRKTAFDVLLDMEENDSYSNLSLNHMIAVNKPADEAFTREIVYGVLKNKILLDYYLDRLISSGISRTGKKEKCILRMGLYQMIFMDSVPAYAAVNESVKMAKRLCRGREGFVNAVLRNNMRKEIPLPEEERDFLSVRYSFPHWIIDLWMDMYGRELCEELLLASNKTPELSVRVNMMKTDRKTLAESLSRNGLSVSEGNISERTLMVKGKGILLTDEYKKGLFSIQDESSVAVADMLAPEPGETVVDVCAAPGGKTAAMAEMMKNSGIIKAFDIYKHKLDLINLQAERLGINIIDTKVTDGIKGDNTLNGKADKVLVDAPCSGLGVLRRKPEIKYKMQGENDELILLQRRILERSSLYLKKGGILVYSTCTVNRNENERQTAWFVSKYPEFRIEMEKQLLPTEATDGFYMCKMIKKG